MTKIRTVSDSPKRLIALRDAERHGVLDEPVVLSRAECEDIVQRALKLSKADACNISVSSSYQTNLRFADNQMSTSGITDDAGISISSVNTYRARIFKKMGLASNAALIRYALKFGLVG